MHEQCLDLPCSRLAVASKGQIPRSSGLKLQTLLQALWESSLRCPS